MSLKTNAVSYCAALERIRISKNISNFRFHSGCQHHPLSFTSPHYAMFSFESTDFFRRKSNGSPSNALKRRNTRSRLDAELRSVKNASERSVLPTTEEKIGGLELSSENGAIDASQAVKIRKDGFRCTADELHFAESGGWNLALWRYKPSPNAPERNHPVLLVPGIATNAMGYDLDPSVSLARHLSSLGFDTWTLEVRGMGFSHLRGSETEPAPEEDQAGSAGEDRAPPAVEQTQLQETPCEDSADAEQSGTSIPASVLDVMSEAQRSTLSARILEIQRRIVARVSSSAAPDSKEAQAEPAPVPVPASTEGAAWEDGSSDGEGPREGSGLLASMRARVRRLLASAAPSESVLEAWDFLVRKVASIVSQAQPEPGPSSEGERRREQQQLLAMTWDFDTMLYEDLPAAMEYVQRCSPAQKVLAVGHSMGGILLYAHLAVFQGPSLAGVVALCSSMDYSACASSFKLILPLEGPVRRMRLRVIPTALLVRAALPLILQPPFSLAWLGHNISARGRMEARLFRRLLRGNFESIPVALLLQMASLFRAGGIRDRSRRVEYRRGLRDCAVPVLALAGNRDLVCPPDAVQDTVKMFPQSVVRYAEFGGQGNNYSHYDLLVSKQAPQEVFPVIADFLIEQDGSLPG